MSRDSALAGIKKLANRAGAFGELVEIFESLWQRSCDDFESALAASWSVADTIPVIPQVLMVKRDDGRLRESIRRVINSKQMDRGQKASIFLAPAVYGDEWARDYLIEDLKAQFPRAMRGGSSTLVELTRGMQRAAVIEHWGTRTELQKLKERFERKEVYNDECRGMVEALLEVQEEGLRSAATRLEIALTARKISATDVAACLILGAARQREHMALLVKIHRDLTGWGFWRTGLRRCALANFAYGTLPGELVQQVIEEWLVRERKKLGSWWFGSARTSELMNACDILWNIEEPLNPRVVSVLQALATGSYKENAKEAIALLSLKGLEVPTNAVFDPDSTEIKWRKDFLHYDQVLNLAYYWRCRPRRGVVEQTT